MLICVLSPQVVEAMEYLKRPERLGLGAQAVIQAKPKRELKMGKPGGRRCVIV